MNSLPTFATDHFQEAKELAMLAIKLGNQSVRLLNLLGKSLLRLQDFSAALSVFKKADSIAPNSISRLCSIADTQQQLGKPEDAVASLAHATDLDPDNQELINSKVTIGLSSGNSELVEESIDKYTSSENILAFINNRAIVHAKSGEFEEGIKLYNNALAALPNNKQRLRETVYYNLALAYARKNDAPGVSKVLTDLKQISDPLLARKIDSLRKRADEAVNDGSPIKLFSDSLPNELKEEQVDPMVRMFDRLTVPKVPNCCVELYKEDSSSCDEKIGPLVKDTISFNIRRGGDW